MTLFYIVTTNLHPPPPPPPPPPEKVCFCVGNNIKRRPVHCLQLPLIITFVNL